jgi:hypothetical protein
MFSKRVLLMVVEGGEQGEKKNKEKENQLMKNIQY